MAFRGTEEDGVLPGPWNVQQGDGFPLWGWSGDEETLPLLTPERNEKLIQEPGRVLAGPWEPKSLNPFETDNVVALAGAVAPARDVFTKLA